MCTHFELLTAILVLVYRTKNGYYLFVGRKRDRTGNLRTAALVLPNAPMGVLLLTYENVPLGFAKNVGNRLNNLYPNEWRIRYQ